MILIHVSIRNMQEEVEKQARAELEAKVRLGLSVFA
jgi:hypothetical protein